MLLRAALQLNLDLARSVIVGDKGSDLQAGRSAGVARCLLVRSGQAIDANDMALADAVHDDLAACVDEVLGSTPGAAASPDT